MMKYLLLLQVLFLLIACEDKSGNMPQQGDYTIKVLLNENMEKQQADFLQTIASVDIIPLELDSVFLTQTAQMRVTDDKIYIFSRQVNELYIYSKAGQKIATISNFGDAPGHYINVSNFSLLSDSTIVMYDAAKANMLFFTNTGEFIKEERVRHVAADNLACINDSLLVLYTKSLTLFDSNKNAFRFVDEYGNVKKTSSRLPLWARNNTMILAGGSPFSYDGNKVFWHQIYDSNIYSFISDSLYCKYTIDFGEYNVPESFFIEHEEDFGDERIINIGKTLVENEWASSIEFFQENNKYVYFQYLFKGLMCFALWDKQTQCCYTVLKNRLGEWSILAGGLLGSYEDSFYMMLSMSNMEALIAYKDKITDERILSLLRQFEEYQTKVHLEEDDYILLSIKMK